MKKHIIAQVELKNQLYKNKKMRLQEHKLFLIYMKDILRRIDSFQMMVKSGAFYVSSDEILNTLKQDIINALDLINIETTLTSKTDINIICKVIDNTILEKHEKIRKITKE